LAASGGERRLPGAPSADPQPLFFLALRKSFAAMECRDELLLSAARPIFPYAN
jgi:hypothetical protein